MTDLAPGTWFESPPGEDGTIIGRDAIRAWLEELSRATDRLQMTSFGTSTEGNPIDALFIGSRLTTDRLAAIERDRRGVVNNLLSGTGSKTWTMPIVLITSGIHATEIGGPQSIPELVHWLVMSDDSIAAEIRERVLTVVVPTLNPDGMDLVEQWHKHTLGTDQAGTLPPLLYHRFAGHDNNRDWLYRNLAETHATIDAIHNTWLPHVTLDQHQMNKNGPRFVLPPYADPWEPNVHPSIIAGTSMLGQAVAADLTASGFAGVMTGRYFDAWEPSRAIQHYRGGIRILAEAASANLAHPIALTVDQLTSTPLPQHMEPTASSPLPWRGGTWRLRDIMNYHMEAAKSLLRHVSIQPEFWTRTQAAAPTIRPGKQLIFHIPFDRSAIDVAANRRLATVLKEAGAKSGEHDLPESASFSLDQPMWPLLSAVLLPKTYPNYLGPTPYDVTTHHLPLLMGATLRVSAGTANPVLERDSSAQNRYLMIDARCHAAPEIIEMARPSGDVWRATKRELVDGVIVEAGTWIVDSSALPSPQQAERVSNGSLPTLPRSAAPVQRRDIVLLDPGEAAGMDHGWTRWWLHARSIPFLEAGVEVVAQLADVASSTTILVADMERSSITSRQLQVIGELINAGADVIAFGGAGRALAEELAASVSSTEFPTGGTVQAPGALVRLRVEPHQQVGMGLDRAIPAMFQRDGTFAVSDAEDGVSVLARFAARDTLISGWMSDANPLRNAPAIVRVRLGGGSLYAFSFKPLFRGQTLVSSPLVHNLLYSTSEPASCPPFAPEKTPAGSTNDRTS